VDFSYGGYLEAPLVCMAGKLFGRARTFIHLASTSTRQEVRAIAIDFDAEVVLIDDDYPETAGWGTRVIG